VALQVEYVAVVAGGLRLRLLRGRHVETCPLRALEGWQAVARRTGPLFRRISAGGRIGASPPHPDSVRLILNYRVALAGLSVNAFERLSPHALRVGFIIEAYDKDVRDEDIMRHNRHRDLPLADLVDQVLATLAWDVPLPQRADWLVMGAWLLQLRSRLLLPAEAPARQAAEGAADRLRERLLGLAGIQALAGWLDARPQLGRDTFARGVFARSAPEHPEALRPGEPELDVVAFLWACVDLFDSDLPQPEMAERYVPPPRADLHSVADARLRILERAANALEGRTLDQLLPEVPSTAAIAPMTPATSGTDAPPTPQAVLKRRSAWTSTFVASLEPAKRGDVLLVQEASFGPVHLALAAAMPAASNTG